MCLMHRACGRYYQLHGTDETLRPVQAEYRAHGGSGRDVAGAGSQAVSPSSSSSGGAGCVK